MFRLSRNLFGICKEITTAETPKNGINFVKRHYSDSQKCTIVKSVSSIQDVSYLIPKMIIPLINPNEHRQTILDKPLPNNYKIKIDPFLPLIKKIDELPIGKKEINDPLLPGIIEKQALKGWNMLVVRRKKMKKHKRKKLRKKMKYVFLKRSKRRNSLKELAFQDEILNKLKEAEQFDPVEYVNAKLNIVNTTIVPYRWHGVRMPEWVIIQKHQDVRARVARLEALKQRRKDMLEERGTLKVE